ncbi:hypothetical protein ACWFRM_09570 [Streptomyces sp. NPDC055144]
MLAALTPTRRVIAAADRTPRRNALLAHPRAKDHPSAHPHPRHLEQGGAANWFVTEMKGETYRDGAAENNWWASTEAGNDRRGRTPEVYFAGGGNHEDDAGLLMPGSYTCANTCTPTPSSATPVRQARP